MQRKLATIVAADIVDFSRLVGVDEEGTLQVLRLRRQDLIEPLLNSHNGRLANTAGDSLLLEFPSEVEAVRLAQASRTGWRRTALKSLLTGVSSIASASISAMWS